MLTGLATADDLSLILYNSSYAVSKGARCLDGSPAGYYLRRAPNGSPNADKWIIFLEGGGLCVEPVDCIARSHVDEGSSRNWKPLRTVGTDASEDFLSNSTLNPFRDWNHVFAPYCSGDTWTGTSRYYSLSRRSDHTNSKLPGREFNILPDFRSLFFGPPHSQNTYRASRFDKQCQGADIDGWICRRDRSVQ